MLKQLDHLYQNKDRKVKKRQKSGALLIRIELFALGYILRSKLIAALRYLFLLGKDPSSKSLAPIIKNLQKKLWFFNSVEFQKISYKVVVFFFSIFANYQNR